MAILKVVKKVEISWNKKARPQRWFVRVIAVNGEEVDIDPKFSKLSQNAGYNRLLGMADEALSVDGWDWPDKVSLEITRNRK